MDAGKWINRISNRLRRRSYKTGKALGLTESQRQILSFIFVEGRERILYQKDIEKEFDLRPSTATELLKGLEERGMLRRVSSESDGRYKEIRILETAREARQEILDEVQKTEAILTAGISKEDMEVFFRVAEKMINNLGD